MGRVEVWKKNQCETPVRAQWGRIGNQSTLILPTMLHSGTNTMHHPKTLMARYLQPLSHKNLPTQVP